MDVIIDAVMRATLSQIVFGNRFGEFFAGFTMIQGRDPKGENLPVVVNRRKLGEAGHRLIHSQHLFGVENGDDEAFAAGMEMFV